jgi:hypothetical protein
MLRLFCTADVALGIHTGTSEVKHRIKVIVPAATLSGNPVGCSQAGLVAGGPILLTMRRVGVSFTDCRCAEGAGVWRPCRSNVPSVS